MLEDLRTKVMLANQKLERNGLVIYTWGNVSGIDREKQLVVIKPSGVPYDQMTPDMMTITDLDGNVIDSDTKPSTDLKTHLELYKAFPEIGGVAHSHSLWGTVWAQMKRDIPCFGTTHADFFDGDIPCTKSMPKELVENDYEFNTGRWIIDHFNKNNLNPQHLPGVLVASHGPFSWGPDPATAVYKMTVLEQIAKIAFFTQISSNHERLSEFYIRMHYDRKHGENAYYGQN